MSADARRRTKSDERLLAQLGYKQEFQRAFKPLEVCHRIPSPGLRPAHVIKVFGIAFSIVGLLPSIAFVRIRLYAPRFIHFPYIVLSCSTRSLMVAQSLWSGGSVCAPHLIELSLCLEVSSGPSPARSSSSSAYPWQSLPPQHPRQAVYVMSCFSPTASRRVDPSVLHGPSSIFGPTLIPLPSGATSSPGSLAVRRPSFLWIAQLNSCFTDANTIGSIASIASIDWGAAIQIMAAAGIGSNGSFTTSPSKTLSVFRNSALSSRPKR